jgi:hypothetical protein
MARFTKIFASIWTSKRFTDLSDADRCAFVYVLTCEHQSAIGVARIPPKYGSADLDRPEQDFIAALGRIEASDLIVRDVDTHEIYVRHWFEFHPPTNSKHALGLAKLFAEVKSEAVRSVARAEFERVEFASREQAASEPKPKSNGATRKVYGGETNEHREVDF